MIVNSPDQFITALADNDFPVEFDPTLRGVFLIEPEGFYVGEETALDNHYVDLSRAADPGRAASQFHDLVRQLESERTDIPAYFTERGYESVDLKERDCVLCPGACAAWSPGFSEPAANPSTAT